jgi:hypothetical protein
MATATDTTAQAVDARPPSRLMRVPLETYELVQASAAADRRHMNQQLAVLVQEALAARKAKENRQQRQSA